jgi:cytoskeletal protein CcmA (bactofilin family)
MFWGSKNKKDQSPKGKKGKKESNYPQPKRGELMPPEGYSQRREESRRDIPTDPNKKVEEFHAATIIAEGTYINGRIEAKNHKILVEGVVEGGIFARHSVIIGDRGKVSYKLEGDHVSVSGKFNGEMNCNWLEVEEGGEVRGEVTTNQLLFKQRGIFEGKNHMKTPIPRPKFSRPRRLTPPPPIDEEEPPIRGELEEIELKNGDNETK